MNLPIEQIYPQLDEILRNQGQCVIVAPPGAGKSTLLPLHLLNIVSDLIILIEPRRVAARAVARRMADILGEAVGKTVGYAMRMERKQSSHTRILVVTEGIFTHMLLDDPELKGVSAILFDEFHERSLDADFGLALALDVRSALRPDLQLIIMSATLDTAKLAQLMGNAPLLEAQGRQFDVEIRYQSFDAHQRLEQAMAATIMRTLAQEHGNILAFLPGQKEIERTASLLATKLDSNILISPLYGALSAQEQDRAIARPNAGERKVVLATSIAQTSLTIESVRIVIDSGLMRVPVFEPDRGLTRLETVRASQADITQRSGRAGRIEPGIAIRLWMQGQTRARPAFTMPEILSADLSSLVLDCAAFGVHDPAQLAFLDQPPAPNWRSAHQLLRQLGAIDRDSRLTSTGNMMRQLGLPVRYAHMVACAPCLKSAELALLLSEHGLGGTDIDIENRFQKFCHDKSAKAQKIKQLAVKIIAKIPGGKKQRIETQISDSIESHSALAALLLQAWPDRVARARGSQGQFLLPNGRAAQIDITHPLSKSEWLVVADLVGKASNSKILAAVEVDEKTIRAHLGNQIETIARTEFNPTTATIRASEQERLGYIELSNRPLPSPSGEIANQAWVAAMRQYGLGILPWSGHSLALRQRLDWLHHNLKEPWPDVTDKTLIDHLPDFLPGLADLKGERDFLSVALLALLPYDLQHQVDQLAPQYFTAPTGSKIALDYSADVPVLRIKVQELFGLAHHPTIADGKVALIIELLSPASRPIQITRDLHSFWHGSWRQVRAEMRGRYPKHVWPEDPLTAAPTRRAKPRGT